MEVNVISLREELEKVGLLPAPTVTCYSCIRAIGTTRGLLCRYHHVLQPVKICDKYMREMGADEPEEV